MVTAIQSNAMPGAGYGSQGSTTATQPVTPTGGMTPAEIVALVESLQGIQARFRQASSFMRVTLDQASYTALGQNKNIKISNVGLGVAIVTEWNVTITVANATTSTRTQDAGFAVSPWWPFNMIQSSQVQINGGATVYSAGGISDYLVYTRQRKTMRRPIFWGAYSSPPTNAWGPQIDLSTLRVTLGSNLTGTNATSDFRLSGLSVIDAAASASTNNTVTVTFLTYEKLAFDKDSLLGALPLQNNATFIQIATQICAALSGTRNDLNMPFFGLGGQLTLTLTTMTADRTYIFASVPDDPGLYSNIIRNSYQVQESTNQTVASTGVKALKYIIPQNTFLVAAHFEAVDSAGKVLPAYDATNGFGDLTLQYNAGTVIPIVQKPQRERFLQYMSYDYDPYWTPGVRWWDGEDSTDDINASDNMMWVDTYDTAAPEIDIDVGTSASTTITYNTCRELVVAGVVQQVGG